MKVSVSLSERDLARLDAHVRKSGLPSRSAAVQEAVRLLAKVDLEQSYAQAWQDWDAAGDADAWDAATGDGLR
jgi:Arc/MetJ-type ribon-helix-helix transcriptional regulator